MRLRCALVGLPLIGAVLVALSACQPAAHEKPDEKTANAPRVTASIDARASTKEAVLTAYHGMWQDFKRAARTADWEDPGIGGHATDDAEVVLRHGLYLAHQKGQVVKGEPQLRPRITDLQQATAKISDCVDDTKFLIYTKNGSPAKGGDSAGRHRTTADLVLRKGSWYVSVFVFREAGTC